MSACGARRSEGLPVVGFNLQKCLRTCALLLCLSCAPAWAQADEHEHSHAPEARSRVEESNVDFFWRKSDEAFHKGDYERAISWHRAIVALSPDDVQSWGVAAWLMWSLGRGDEATAWIDRGLRANPGSWEMWNAAAQQADLQKLAPRALESYQHALKLLPTDADKRDAQMLRRRLAHAAERNADLDLSAQTWRDLVRDFPDEAVNKNNLARVQAHIQAQSRPQVLGAQ